MSQHIHMTTLQIYLLGKFQILSNGEIIPPDAFVTKKAILLLKILLTRYPHPTNKDQLLEWLWPNVGPEVGAKSLRAATSRLRRALEPNLPRYASSSFIHVSGGRYHFQPSVETWLDVVAFETLAKEGQVRAEQSHWLEAIKAFQAARHHYQGDYLAEDRYMDWAIAERERLREVYLNITSHLADISAQQRQYQEAITLCQEVLAADQLRESVWRQLMRYHFYAGNPALALQAYQTCKQTLHQELAIAPDTETTNLQIEIQQSQQGEQFLSATHLGTSHLNRQPRLPVILGRMPFVGRRDEFEWLHRQLTEVGQGHPRLVLIEGEAGIGKTRLAEESLAYAQQHGFTILTSRGRERSADQPYQAIREALLEVITPDLLATKSVDATWLAAVAEIIPDLSRKSSNLPDLPTLAPEQEKQRLFKALTQILLAQITSTGLILLFDDLQWVDSATLEFLTFFINLLDHQPILFLYTVRSEEINPIDSEQSLARFLWELKRVNKLHRIALTSLSQKAVTTLWQAMSGLSAESELDQKLYHETAGHPLYLQATLQALFEEGEVVVNDTGTWQLQSQGRLAPEVLTPRTVKQMIGRRLDRLAPDSRQVLETAAVLGRSFSWTILRQMRRQRWDVMFDTLEHLTEGLFIQEQTQDQYSFNHDKIQEVVYDTIPAERRRWLHRKAGEALEGDSTDQLDEMLGTLAYHFSKAAEYPKAFKYWRQAGRYATRIYAHTEAMKNCQAALALVEQNQFQPPAESLADLYEQLARLYEALGQYSEAMVQVNLALQHTRLPAVQVRLKYRLVHYHDRLGQANRRELLEELVTEINQFGTDQIGHLESARVYARWAIIGSYYGPEVSARYAALTEQALLAYRPTIFSEPTQLAWAEFDVAHTALISLGEMWLYWGRFPEALDILEKSLLLAKRQENDSAIGFSCNNTGDVLCAQGKFSEARPWYPRAAAAWETAGQQWLQMVAHGQHGLSWAAEDQWANAVTSLHQARAIGESVEPTLWLANVYLFLALAEIKLTGNQIQAKTYLEQATTTAEISNQQLPSILWHLAQSALYNSQSDWQTAQQILTERIETGRVGTEWKLFYPWLVPQFEPSKLRGSVDS